MAARRAKLRHERLPPNTPLGRYWVRTQRPLNCLLFVAPLIAAYEAGIALAGTDLLARNQLEQFLGQLGASAAYLPAGLVIVTLLAWQLLSSQKWRLDGGAVVLMYLESLAWAVPLLGLWAISRRLMMAAGPLVDPGLAVNNRYLHELLAGIGGGVYEEFLFRLVGLNLVTLVLVDVLELRATWATSSPRSSRPFCSPCTTSWAGRALPGRPSRSTRWRGRIWPGCSSFGAMGCP